jgi:hypothetical protein
VIWFSPSSNVIDLGVVAAPAQAALTNLCLVGHCERNCA